MISIHARWDCRVDRLYATVLKKLYGLNIEYCSICNHHHVSLHHAFFPCVIHSLYGLHLLADGAAALLNEQRIHHCNTDTVLAQSRRHRLMIPACSLHERLGILTDSKRHLLRYADTSLAAERLHPLAAGPPSCFSLWICQSLPRL